MKRILVVDDDRNTREALVFLLTSAGYEVYEASDGEDALEYLERLPFHLVLLDHGMPRKTGLQVMETLSHIVHSTKIILITAHDSDEVRQQSKALRAAAFVVKPLNRQRLMKLVEKTLGQSPDGPTHPKDRIARPVLEKGMGEAEEL